jgi:uncharacterized protein HemX
MKNIGWKIFGGFILLMILLCALDLGTGYFGVLRTKTVEKAQQNANREVFEQTQSYVEGKRQDLVRYHHEWVKADADGKKDIESTVRLQFANFDKTKILDTDLYAWLTGIMNN